MNDFLWSQPYFKRLAELVSQKAKRIVAFSGAGASREAGLPDWNGLIAKLQAQYETLATSAMGEQLTQEIIKKAESIQNNWDKMEYLFSMMKEQQFDLSIRAILSPSERNVPTFYRKIWDLNPDAILSLNLDNYSSISYAQRKT